MSTPGQLPQSLALAEASADSLTEFFSRDPEGFTRQDRDRMVMLLQEQRARWEAADAASPTKPKRVSAAGASLITNAKAEDLGL